MKYIWLIILMITLAIGLSWGQFSTPSGTGTSTTNAESLYGFWFDTTGLGGVGDDSLIIWWDSTNSKWVVSANTGGTDSVTVYGWMIGHFGAQVETVTVWYNRGYPEGSTTEKGILQASSDNFSASSGIFVIKDNGVNGDELADSVIEGRHLSLSNTAADSDLVMYWATGNNFRGVTLSEVLTFYATYGFDTTVYADTADTSLQASIPLADSALTVSDSAITKAKLTTEVDEKYVDTTEVVGLPGGTPNNHDFMRWDTGADPDSLINSALVMAWDLWPWLAQDYFDSTAAGSLYVELADSSGKMDTTYTPFQTYVSNHGGAGWNWADSAGEPPFWVDSSKYSIQTTKVGDNSANPVLTFDDDTQDGTITYSGTAFTTNDDFNVTGNSDVTGNITVDSIDANSAKIDQLTIDAARVGGDSIAEFAGNALTVTTGQLNFDGGASPSGDLGNTWASPTVTDFTITGETTGDVLYFNGSNWLRLAIGSPGQVLEVSPSNIPEWDADDGAGGGSNDTVTVITDNGGNPNSINNNLYIRGSSTIDIDTINSVADSVRFEVKLDGITNAHFTHSTDWGDISISGTGSATIDQDVVTTTKLDDASDTPVDGDILTVAATTSQIEYHTPTELALMEDEDINTFSELQTWVSGKTLLNEEDAATIDVTWTFGADLIVTDSIDATRFYGDSLNLGEGSISEIYEVKTPVDGGVPVLDTDATPDTLFFGGLSDITGSVTDAQVPDSIAVTVPDGHITYAKMQSNYRDSLGNLYQDETISGNWVNTASPWADNEIASSGDWNTAHDSSQVLTANYQLISTMGNFIDSTSLDTIEYAHKSVTTDSSLQTNIPGESGDVDTTGTKIAAYGANIRGDVRDTVKVIPRIFCATISNPDSLNSDTLLLVDVRAERFASGLTITDIGIVTRPSSSYSVTFQEWTEPDASGTETTIETVATSSSKEAEDNGTIDDGAIAAGSFIVALLPSTDIEQLEIWIVYHE